MRLNQRTVSEMEIAGIREHLVAEHQRVGNTKLDVYNLERHQSEKKRDESQRQDRAADERIRQARMTNNNLGQNIDIYC